MFAAWKQAWKDAVENFYRELDPDHYGPASDRMTSAMKRDIDTARASLRRVEADLARASQGLALELENETDCRRRESLARKIDDLETARIAEEFAARHAERATILRRKTDALTAERDLLRRDLDSMLATLHRLDPGADHPPTPAGWDRPDQYDAPEPPLAAATPVDTDFERLEREARERAAEARLRELKEKLR